MIRFWKPCVSCLLSAALMCDAFASGARGDQPRMRALVDEASGQIDVFDGQQPALRYNFATVSPPVGYIEKLPAAAKIYARPRSNYIHPLYGLSGEELTADWASDHPHHRGTYWAWPEVEYRSMRGDFHALQRIFARPVGQPKLISGDDRATIVAENMWKWDGRLPIVRERTTIEVLPAGDDGRYVDLTFRLTAVSANVTLARRGTRNYGGLNLRMSKVEGLEFVKHTDPADADPRRSWGDTIGVRGGASRPSGLAMFERAENPDYPGDWVSFDGLPWLQPTFPAAGTRFALPLGEPVTLRYRLWIHQGGKQSDEEYARQWTMFQAAE